VEPVQKMLGLRVQVHLEIADRIAAIRQERNRLVHLHPLRFKHLEPTALGLFREVSPAGCRSRRITFALDGLMTKAARLRLVAFSEKGSR